MDNVAAKAREWGLAFDSVGLGGPWAEFGVATGQNMRKFILPAARERHPQPEIWGFDSWEGLPEAWDRGETVKNLPKGHFACDVPLMLMEHDPVRLIKGWFTDTVPMYAEGEPWAFIHIDCDLYSSTLEVLYGMNDRIVPGTVIRFDEFQGYPNARNHEERAFWEWYDEFDRRATLIAESKGGSTWKVTI